MGLVELLFGLDDRCLRLADLSLEFGSVHPRQHLAESDRIPLLDQHLFDPPRQLRGNVQALGLDAPVRASEPDRNATGLECAPCDVSSQRHPDDRRRADLPLSIGTGC